MSLNTILWTKTTKLNQIMNNDAFVSYGKVLTCKDGIIEIAGLRDVMAGEVVKLGNDQMGMISNLEKNSVSAIVLGDDTAIVQGDLVTSTGSLLYVPVGANLLGRVVDSLGVPIDGLESINYDEFAYIESKAPGIIIHNSIYKSVLAKLRKSLITQKLSKLSKNLYKFATVSPAIVKTVEEEQILETVREGLRKNVDDTLYKNLGTYLYDLIPGNLMLLACVTITFIMICVYVSLGREWLLIGAVTGIIAAIGFVVGLAIGFKYASNNLRELSIFASVAFKESIIKKYQISEDLIEDLRQTVEDAVYKNLGEFLDELIIGGSVLLLIFVIYRNIKLGGKLIHVLNEGSRTNNKSKNIANLGVSKDTIQDSKKETTSDVEKNIKNVSNNLQKSSLFASVAFKESIMEKYQTYEDSIEDLRQTVEDVVYNNLEEFLSVLILGGSALFLIFGIYRNIKSNSKLIPIRRFSDEFNNSNGPVWKNYTTAMWRHGGRMIGAGIAVGGAAIGTGLAVGGKSIGDGLKNNPDALRGMGLGIGEGGIIGIIRTPGAKEAVKGIAHEIADKHAPGAIGAIKEGTKELGKEAIKDKCTIQ